MTIRSRLTLWYAGVIFVCLVIMGVLTYMEFAPEPQVQNEAQIEDQKSDLHDVLKIILWCGIPAGVLAVGGGWWLTRRALAPITQLTQAVERINECNLGESLPSTGTRDELGRLTDVFNAMIRRLDGSFQRIREFTLHASHELKTPLTVLHGELETALREDISPAQRERFVSQLDEVQRLSKIVDGLTLLTKADAGEISLRHEPLQFDELVREAFADAQILARSSEIQINLVKSDPVRIQGDRHRLRQLLLNLTDNAIKYNQPKGSVDIVLRRVPGDRSELAISNTGNGIPRESVPHVFERFFRGDPAHSSEVEGCGLGLSIAQWIVSAHHGTITIDSDSARRTTVTVRFPIIEESNAA
jgi:signal transduction histidine kinase